MVETENKSKTVKNQSEDKKYAKYNGFEEVSIIDDGLWY